MFIKDHIMCPIFLGSIGYPVGFTTKTNYYTEYHNTHNLKVFFIVLIIDNVI